VSDESHEDRNSAVHFFTIVVPMFAMRVSVPAPSSTHPIRSQLKQLVYQSIIA
jgi:hypothetical protein